ncbi:uncharacterized protein [Dysidea avara]|uniref:uncharacterized protein isoform X2 n=1 Tax=Dysidea avara TaxID=196820 RepID=UPI0033346A1F
MMTASKETSLIAAILLCCTFVVVIEGSRQFTKAYSRSLTINSECLDGHWFINGKPPPPEWVQSNGDLLLPANNWMTIGIVSLQCDSVTNIYEIMSPGETCEDCLLIYTSFDGDICVGNTSNVTVTTGQSQPHEGAFTLLVNDSVCHSGGGGSGVVTCREQSGDVFQQTTFSYTVTAIDTGMVTIKAHTTYYEAEWYSTSIAVTIRECDMPDGDVTDDTNISIVVLTNMSNPRPSPTISNDPRNEKNTTTIPLRTNTPPTLPSEVDTKDGTEGGVIAAIIISSVALLIVSLLLLLVWLWRRKYKKKKQVTPKDQPEMPFQHEPHPPEPVELDDDDDDDGDGEMSLPQPEYSTVRVGGPVDVYPLPVPMHVLPTAMGDSSSSTASQES